MFHIVLRSALARRFTFTQPGLLSTSRRIQFFSMTRDLRRFQVNESLFDVPNRYMMAEPIGQGAYGLVCSAIDERSGVRVAIKKIENAFEHLTFTKRTLRELKILRQMQHENVIAVREVFVPDSQSSFTDIYVVSDLMDTDLASILKSNQGISSEHICFFMYQLLRGLKYVHSAGVIHRDLKPRNLLVSANCDLKICDFGLSRVTSVGPQTTSFTEYVCTRWYRAPEVLCGSPDYGPAVDMWSVGCIFGEMLSGKPLFPGQNTRHQLQVILKVLGCPRMDKIKRIGNLKCRRFLETSDPSLPTLHSMLKISSESAIALLEALLDWDPEGRIDVRAALSSAYLADYHEPDDEPSRAHLNLEEFEFENRPLELKMLRTELFQEARHYS